MAAFDIYYKVSITPRSGTYTYGSAVDVSDLVDVNGISSIKGQIDSTDYDMGAFKYSDVTIKGINRNGYFNDENDKRSIFFPFSRDLAKVNITFTNTSGDTIVFNGLLNEEATKLDFKNDVISFRVLSLDSVIRSTNVSSGTISDGSLCSAAIKTILNVPAITAILTYDATKINVASDFIIDLGSALEQMTTRDALNMLLVASNSVMTLTSAGVMVIKSRAATNTGSILNLYGPYDQKRRENTVDLKDYNSGKHRMFNSFLINDTQVDNHDYVAAYGFRQKTINMDFITNNSTEADIGATLVDEFNLPKIELSVDVPTFVAKDSSLLDRVSLDWPLRITPYTGSFLPVIGDAVIGDATTKLPNRFGSLNIDPGIAFKIIEINHNPSNFITTLKLRQSGTTYADGYYRTQYSNIVGFAVVGSAVI